MSDNVVDAFRQLVEIVYLLRRECPWDRAQTIYSMRPYTIEEVFELSEGILNDDMKTVKEELGDILLHVVFYSVIAEEKGHFSLQDVIAHLTKKLIVRHPHVFKERIEFASADDVKDFWEKAKSKGDGEFRFRVPEVMPSFQRALRIQEKARVLNLDWQSPHDVVEKISEEVKEVKGAMEGKDKKSVEEEIGDLLFAIVALCRHLKIDPERALLRSTSKFVARAEKFVAYCKERGIEPGTLPPHEVDKIWDEIVKNTSIHEK